MNGLTLNQVGTDVNQVVTATLTAVGICAWQMQGANAFTSKHLQLGAVVLVRSVEASRVPLCLTKVL